MLLPLPRILVPVTRDCPPEFAHPLIVVVEVAVVPGGGVSEIAVVVGVVVLGFS